MKLPLWGSALSATLLVQVVSSFASAAIPLLGPIFTQRWGLPPESIGYVSAVVSIGICWCLACGGPMLDHHGPVRTLQFGLASIGLGMVFLAQPVAVIGLLGALLVGLGLAPNNPAGSKLLMSAAPARHRNLIFSIRQAGVPLGGAIAGVSVAPAVVALGLAPTIWLIAVIVILSLLAVQPFQKRLDSEKGPMNRAWPRNFLSPSALLRSAKVIRSHPSLPLITGIGVSFSIAQASVQAFTATYLVTQLGKDLTEAGYFVAVLLAGSTVSRIFLGWLADRWGRGLLLLCLLSLGTSAALVLLVWSAAAPSWIVYVSVALVGATSLGWNGIYMAELARLSPPALIGDVTSAANLFGFAGSVCGPLLFALVVRQSGGFDWPYLLVAGQLAACGIFSLSRRGWR
ncbi:sugar phosphate permease [Bosea sp. BK604]|nr:sugar phosphate permease [Bosea sp. BK604]